MSPRTRSIFIALRVTLDEQLTTSSEELQRRLHTNAPDASWIAPVDRHMTTG